MSYKKFNNTTVFEITKWDEDFIMSGVLIGPADVENGSPKKGDVIARDPKDHSQKWLINKSDFKSNFKIAK